MNWSPEVISESAGWGFWEGHGLVDPVQLARKQLANRGLDGNGRWIGFDAAAQAWEVER